MVMDLNLKFLAITLVLALEDDGGVGQAGFVRQNSNTLQIVTGDNSDNKIQISKTSDTSYRVGLDLI